MEGYNLSEEEKREIEEHFKMRANFARVFLEYPHMVTPEDMAAWNNKRRNMKIVYHSCGFMMTSPFMLLYGFIRRRRGKSNMLKSFLSSRVRQNSVFRVFRLCVYFVWK